MANPELEALLRVQALDTEADQLHHRRATLPEITARAEAQARLTALDADATGLAGQRDEVAARQQRLEQEVDAIERRVAELEKRLYAGTGPARDLQLISHEVDQLKHRRSALDDDTLEAMEEREPLDQRLEALAAERATITADIERLDNEVAARQAEIDAELAKTEAARTAEAEAVGEGLRDRYEKLRTRLGGVGAAALVGNSCSGCHLTLPATALDQLRKQAPGTIATCEQCGRILVP